MSTGKGISFDDKTLLRLKAELQEELRRDLFFQLGLMEERMIRRLEDQLAVQRTHLQEDIHREVLQLEVQLEQTLEDDRSRLEKDVEQREREIEFSLEEQLLTCKAELEDQL